MDGRVRPELGLVCITASDRVRYRTITRKRLLALPEAEQRQALDALYRANLARFEGALDFCIEREIRLYRITTDLFPFADTELGAEILAGLRDAAGRAGRHATAAGIRLILHPDQFVVLSSDSPQVIANSVQILALHGRVMDYLEQPRSPWAAINVHGGKAGRGARLVETIRTLPDPVRLRLTLENDEYAYGARELLDICRAAGVPMVFDAHHHVCHEGLPSYDDPGVADLLAAARDTWPEPSWQLVHISNGRESFNDRRHSDLIAAMPAAYRQAPWIEIEAKHKELAIERLRADWLES